MLPLVSYEFLVLSFFIFSFSVLVLGFNIFMAMHLNFFLYLTGIFYSCRDIL